MNYLKFYNYIASQSKVPKGERPALGFVTISRQAGAGGITIAEKLAEYLNKETVPNCPWTVFDKNLVHEVIKEHNLSQRMQPFLQESSIAEIQDLLEDLLRLHPAQFTLVQRTNKTILRLAKMGHSILVGRGAPVITREIAGGVHVRLVGSLKKRKEHLKEYLKFDDKEAKIFIKNEDEGRAQYLKKYFDRNIDDPLLYDLVINSDQISYDDGVSLIGGLVLRKEKVLQAA